MKILITGGATREPVDEVRFLTNMSTGTTAACLADHLNRQGADITLLHGAGATLPKTPLKAEGFATYDDLAAALKKHLGTGDYNAVIHAAAVGDYQVKKIISEKGDTLPDSGKISSQESLCLHLEPTPKLVEQIHTWAKSPLKLIAFKLTVDATEEGRAEKALNLLKHSQANAVVSNDLTEMKAKKSHPFRFFTGDKTPPSHGQGVEDMADKIWEILK